ncbi:CDP-glucose 4,6-dehydratase [Terracoccus sp. 273MFTsu3.1]|uniref:CDP-glucose 4,6-dehydratase n=1 Tax=Terracoccus sp. 273MFTsu3.1 TaxID=1172188 RepID=UPI0003661323|nr:CDP-glucose 4,6-dehydratase [Terracoccus sp. 273MFTsu3.1]
MIDSHFWPGKRVLVTGHTGFKGSWLTLWLTSLGAEVTGYALPPPTSPSMFAALALGDGIESVIGDVRDEAMLKDIVLAAAPEIVFHLAAQPLVRRSYADPVGTYATNVLGTVHLLEAVRATPGVRVVVNVTSDKAYENSEGDRGYRETDPMGGHDPYSSSKGCAELVTSTYRRSFFAEGATALASARAGNVLGGGDWAEDRLVPDILRAFAAGEKAEIRNPGSVRPWQHVLEPLSGYLLLAQRLWLGGQTYAEGWNFGPHEGDARPVSWIADALAREWGNGAVWGTEDRRQPHEATYLRLDVSKARRQLGWGPRWSLADALTHVVAWQRAWLSGDDVHALCLQQIDDYARTSPLETT